MGLFPNLSATNFSVTSDCTINYNCLAWAAWDDKTRWEPDALGLNYWPPKVPREYTINAFKRAYRAHGFSTCDSPEPEDGYEKIAIFAVGDQPKHAARLTSGGLWASKIGDLWDIEHELNGVTNASYGEPHTFMRRRLR